MTVGELKAALSSLDDNTEVSFVCTLNDQCGFELDEPDITTFTDAEDETVEICGHIVQSTQFLFRVRLGSCWQL